MRHWGIEAMASTYQAWFDDSGSKGSDKVMVMSGVFGSAEVLASVADEWSRYLAYKHPRKIAYFKMEEACGLSGEFNWCSEADRDEKVRQLAAVIDRDDLFQIAVAVDLRAFERQLDRWKHTKERAATVRHPPYQPWFRDDKEFVMLQAADLLAGEIRLLGRDDDPFPYVGTICKRLKADGHFKLINAKDLAALDAHLIAIGHVPDEVVR
jgi:hypothetical protein